ncbi:hypothetical protein HanXRQr2_Chr14g0633741 [Helianthus annuus]|uniref:Uncharacterized protein n=1 Tax=Helianthus annuus TaxID=4232 RepID=A0A9K3E756_HELAN|nr:hypothetical protein HanXRQr2_Chr14g0633741 [Helianthus annuus]KAJ0839512.1 hypothetical protein HanPSC8_Chr14g0607731 [Helianthus annuus]
MVPPKGITKWKTKFFYIKAVAVTAKLTFRNVTDTIITETISVPKVDTVDWFPRLRIIGWKILSNSQMWVLRMMLGRMSRKARSVVREKSGGNLGPLGDPDAIDVPKKRVEKGVRFRKPKKTHEPAIVPPLVPQVAGISRTRLRSYNDYVVVSDTLEGLGILGGGAVASGSSAGSKPADEKKRKVDAAGAGEQKRPKLRRTRTAAISQPKPTVVTGKRSPSIEVVTPPSAHAEDARKKAAGQSIFNTVDSSDNLIEPRDIDVEGGEKPKSPEAEKPTPPPRPLVVEKTSGSTAAGMGFEGSSIQPGETELEFYYRSYTENWGVNYHRPPWTVMQGDDISNDPSACRNILSGLAPRLRFFVPVDYRVLGRKEEEIDRLRAEAEAMVKVAREGAEQVEREKAAFEKQKQTEAWAATARLKQVRTLSKLLSDERKGWREACARENEKLFRVRQQVTNLKAANVALVKEKAAGEAAAKEAKEAEARGAKALVEGLKVTARAAEAEARAREAAEARDSLISSLDQVKADRDWMRDHDIGHVLSEPFLTRLRTRAVNELKERAREAGFKAGYNECLNHVNPFYKSKFTEDRSGFHGVDTEARYVAAINAYNRLSISALEDIDKCLEAEDYVDRLRLLYDDPEEEEAAGGAKGDAGTSGTKED